MARHDTIANEHWRIQAHDRAGRCVYEWSSRYDDVAGETFRELAYDYVRRGHTIRLQVRRAGASRYCDVLVRAPKEPTP